MALERHSHDQGEVCSPRPEEVNQHASFKNAVLLTYSYYIHIHIVTSNVRVNSYNYLLTDTIQQGLLQEQRNTLSSSSSCIATLTTLN